MVESFSDKDLPHLAPSEKCRVRKGFLELELAPILGTFPSLQSAKSNSPLKQLPPARFFNVLSFLASALKAFFDIFNTRFSPNMQMGQVGSYLSATLVNRSKHPAWKRWPQTRTATIVYESLWFIFSFKSFLQISQVCEPEEGEHESLSLDWSLSKDHLRIWEEVMSSGKVCTDQQSEKLPWDPTLKSWLPVERAKDDDLPSDAELARGDFIFKILLSDICLSNCLPGEWRPRLDGVELGGTAWFRGDKLSAVGVESGEGIVVAEKEIFEVRDSTFPSESSVFFTWKENRLDVSSVKTTLATANKPWSI